MVWSTNSTIITKQWQPAQYNNNYLKSISQEGIQFIMHICYSLFNRNNNILWCNDYPYTSVNTPQTRGHSLTCSLY